MRGETGLGFWVISDPMYKGLHKYWCKNGVLMIFTCARALQPHVAIWSSGLAAAEGDSRYISTHRVAANCFCPAAAC